MNLPDIKIYDRSYDDLVNEAISMIQDNCYDDEWTDYNPSDPGITLVELFAYIIEKSLKDMDYISENTYRNFAKLIGVKDITDNYIEVIKRARNLFVERNRALTFKDFEELTLNINNEVKRAKASMKMINEYEYIEIVVYLNDSEGEFIENNVCDEIFKELKKVSIMGIRFVVVKAKEKKVNIKIDFRTIKDRYVDKNNIREQVESEINRFLCPINGGVDSNGWIFGRSLYKSELFNIIKSVDGVDFVKDIKLSYDEISNEEKIKKIEERKNDNCDIDCLDLREYHYFNANIICNVMDKYKL